MPAAAVIPAPIAYIKVVAVKKLVVGFRVLPGVAKANAGWCLPSGIPLHSSLSRMAFQDVYCEKIRVFKAGDCRKYISMG